MSNCVCIFLGKQLTNETTDTSAGISLLNELNNSTPKSADTSTNFNINTSTSLSNQDDDHKAKTISIGKRLIANLIPSSAFQPLKYPFPDEEHFLLGFDSKYYVNDKNLSSIVAFTLRLIKSYLLY